MKENEALKLLAECEQGLRSLLAEAAGQGDYTAVLRITDWAKAVAALAAESTVNPSLPSNGSPRSSNGNATVKQGDSAGTVALSRRARQISDDYPRFFRRGDELVKVGWSKKDRREYNHRAPRQAVDAVAAAVRQVGAKGRLFNGDALLPVKNEAGVALPDYQAYVALAWLKQLGVVDQRGRRSGYTLLPSKQIDSTITTAWPELAEWRG